jgi:hypothetical protein
MLTLLTTLPDLLMTVIVSPRFTMVRRSRQRSAGGVAECGVMERGGLVPAVLDQQVR